MESLHKLYLIDISVVWYAKKMTEPISDNDLKKMLELLNYCYTCNACNIACSLNLMQQFSPRYYLTKLKQAGLSALDTFLHDNPDLWKCLTCQQCLQACPMAKPEEGMNFVEIVRILRERAHTEKINDSLQQSFTHNAVLPINSILQSQNASLKNTNDEINNDITLKTSQSGEIGLFLGCSDIIEERIGNADNSLTLGAKGAIKILNQAKIAPVVLDTKCCGHDLYWMGMTDHAIELAKYNIESYKQAGIKTVLTICAEGYYMWKFVYPKLVPEFNYEVFHFSEYIIENKILDKLISRPLKMTVTYHDPCRLGRLSHIYEPPRQILSQLPGIKFIEMKHNKEASLCCGVPLFMDCTPEKQVLRELRIKEAQDINADYIITTCPKCIVHYNCYLNGQFQHNSDHQSNYKKVPKLIDLSTFLAQYFLLL